MKPINPKDIERIALLNFGGIGDEILFSPVIHAIRQAYPDAHITLILEARSGRIRELLPQLDATVEIQVQGKSRSAVFAKLLKILRGRCFDAVVSSGSSPFIPILLFLSGIGVRIGFDTGKLSQRLLTKAAPLNRKAYAGDMYFTLAHTFLEATFGVDIPLKPAIPKLAIDTPTRVKAEELLAPLESSTRIKPTRIFIHPGVSRMSIEKNIQKAWPVSNWSSLIEQLLREIPDSHVYLSGGPDDAETLHALNTVIGTMDEGSKSRVFNLYGKTTSLRDLAGLFVAADILVSVDSAPLHLAIGLGVPVVAIFASTDEKKLIPQKDSVAVAARADLECRPCLWDVRQTSCDNPVCLNVPVDTVLAQVHRLLDTTPNHTVSKDSTE